MNKRTRRNIIETPEKRDHICKLPGVNENGLRGKSGDLGLNGFANNSSPESELEVRAREPTDANPLLSWFALCCCCAWTDWGGRCAIVFTVPDMGAGVGLGSELWWMLVWKELKDEMAMSGDWGERRWRAALGVAVIC